MTVTDRNAEDLVAGLIEGSGGLRACALISPAGDVLAATADADWATQAERLWRAAADPLRGDAEHVQVAIDGGELFAVRGERATAIGVADRFSLASLVLCDLREALRQLAGGGAE